MKGNNSSNRNPTSNSSSILVRLLENGITTNDSRLTQRVESCVAPQTPSFQQNSVEVNRPKSLVIPREQCFDDADYTQYEQRPIQVEQRTSDPELKAVKQELTNKKNSNSTPKSARQKLLIIPSEQCFEENESTSEQDFTMDVFVPLLNVTHPTYGNSINVPDEQSTKIHDLQTSRPSVAIEQPSVTTNQDSPASFQVDLSAPVIDTPIIDSELPSEEFFDMNQFRLEAIALLSKPDPFVINTPQTPFIEQSQESSEEPDIIFIGATTPSTPSAIPTALTPRFLYPVDTPQVPFIEQSEESERIDNTVSEAPKKNQMLSNAPQMDPQFDYTFFGGQEEEQVNSTESQPELDSTKLKESSKLNMQPAESYHMEDQQPKTTTSSEVTPLSSEREASSTVAFSTSIPSVPVASPFPLSPSLPTSNLTSSSPPASANRSAFLNEPIVASSQPQQINRKRKTMVKCTGVDVPSVKKSQASSSQMDKGRTSSEEPEIILIGTTTQSTPSAIPTAPTPRFLYPVRRIASPYRAQQINRKRKVDFSSMLTGIKQTPNTRKAFKVINPKNDLFDVVHGRFSMGHYQQKYIITREEVRRRLKGPEKLNNSSLLCNLKRTQVLNKKELVGNLLKNKGLNVQMNASQSVPITKVISLTEAEAVHLGQDLKDSVANFYPTDKISKEVAMKALEMNKAGQEDMMDNEGFLDCMSSLRNAFTSVVPPITGIKPSPSFNKKLNNGLEDLSCVTHGFAIASHRVWLQEITKIGKGIPPMMQRMTTVSTRDARCDNV